MLEEQKSGAKMKNKKAFTLSEVLVCLAVVGVIAMIIVPLITKTTQNREKFLYKKAINTMQNAVSAVMNENGVVNSSNFWPELSNSGVDISKAIGSKIMLLGGVRPEGGSGDSLTNPTFRSNDGMVWWNIPQSWPQDAEYVDVVVDVNGEGGKNQSSQASEGQVVTNPDQLQIRIMKDGRVMVPRYDDADDSGYDWSFERDYLLSQSIKDTTNDSNNPSNDVEVVR
jgi:prepilin-type N-terminal cleavage/methylation domain-containing protein